MLIAALTGMLSVDLGLWSAADVMGHQGYSLLAAILYGVGAMYTYTNAYSKTAIWFYALAVSSLGASAYTGYLLVFYSTAG